MDADQEDPLESREPAAPAERYKRRVENRAPAPSSGGGRGKAMVITALLVAGLVALLLWLQPWKSTPLEVTAVQNERVELVALPGGDLCFWRFDVAVSNTSDERVWITAVELFLNDQIVRPDTSFGSIDPGVTSAIPVELFLDNAGSDGRCPAVAVVDHSPVDVLHATLDETFTASASF